MHRFSVIFAFVLCSTVRAWIHPGILHKTVDLDRMKTNVAAKTNPWFTAYNVFAADTYSSATYTPHTPTATLTERFNLEADGTAAYQNALMWYITGDATHASKAISILNSWASTMKSIGVVSTDTQLAASLGPFALINAAEIIRYTKAGWASSDISTFADFITSVIYPYLTNHTRPNYEANVGTGNTKALLAIGVFAEDQAIYNDGITNFQTEACSGLTEMINAAGQDAESGRDQQHAQLGIGNMAESAQVAWLQGTNDLFSLSTNRILSGYEYTASYNLGNTVTYDASFQRCDAAALGGPFTTISSSGRGSFRPVYELAYRHYVQESGITATFTSQVVNKVGTEGANPVNSPADNSAWGTLKFRI